MARRTFPPIASTPPYHSQEISSFGAQPEAATSMLNEELRRIASSNQDLYDKLGRLGDVFSALGIDVDKFDPDKGKHGGGTGIPNLDRLRYVINGPIGGEISRTGTVTNNPSVFNTTNTGGPGTNTTTTTIDKEKVTEIVRDELPIPGALKLFHPPGGPRYDQNYHSYSVAFEAIPLPGSKFMYSGLVFDGDTTTAQTDADAKYYDTTTLRKLAHGMTSAWNDTTQPMNARRLFPSSWRYADFPSGLPGLQDADGSMALPYMVIDKSHDNFGHAHVAKIAHAVDLVNNALHNDDWYNTLNTSEIDNIKNTINNGATNLWNTVINERPPSTPLGPCVPGTGGGTATMVYAGTTVPCTGDPRPTTEGTALKDLILYNSGIEYRLESAINTPITFRNQNEKWYNPSRKVYIGHGMTSQWTVGLPSRPYNPSKNDYFAAHHFYSGNWSDHNFTNPATRTVGLMNPSQAAYDTSADMPNSRGTQAGPGGAGMVMVDLLADDWGHVQFGVWETLQRLTAGRGLAMQFDTWYDPTKANTIGHPLINTAHNQNNQKRFTGTPNWYPSDFTTNDSGHLTAVHWSQLPVIQGPPGEPGTAATVTGYLRTFTVQPRGTPAPTFSVTALGTPTNRNFAFDVAMANGLDGLPGDPGGPGAPGANATIEMAIRYVTTGVPNATLVPYGTASNAKYWLDLVLPEAPDGTGDINNYYITNNNEYVTTVDNIGSYGTWRSLVQNPGANNPIYIKRVGAEGALETFEIDNTVTFTHKSVAATYVSADWIYTPGLGFTGTAAYIEPQDLGDGVWRFPGLEMNSTGHIINTYGVDISLGGGTGGSSYIWTAATALDAEDVTNNDTVRFLSTDPTKLSITQDGLDINFSLDAAFEDLVFGNGFSQDPNTIKTEPYSYDPLVGTTVHVNNDLKDVAGIVRKGSDPYVAGLVKKVWGTDQDDHPNWRETVIFRGGQNIDIEFVGVEDGIKVYQINYVPY